MAEQLTLNQLVQGSSPWWITKTEHIRVVISQNRAFSMLGRFFIPKANSQQVLLYRKLEDEKF